MAINPVTAEALKAARDSGDVVTFATSRGTFQGIIERIIVGPHGELAVKLDTTNGWVYLR